jgi:diguanylate cyclase (GGDEF)-like protein/PAS domain S-box-containing protein
LSASGIEINQTEEFDEQLRWRTAVESAGHGIWDINHANGKTYYSPQWYEMRGLDPAKPELSSYDYWFNRIHPEDQPLITALINFNIAQKLNVVRFEYRERHADGHYIWILSRGRVVSRDAEGNSIRSVGTDLDVTQLKNSETELRLLYHRFGLAVGAAKMGVWEYEIGSGELNWDATTRELFGAPPAGPLRHDMWVSCLHPEDRSRILEVFSKAEKTGGRFEFNYRIVLANGDVRHIRSRSVRHIDRVTGPRLFGVAWDVTPDVKRAEELKRSKEIAEIHSAELELAHRKMAYEAFHDSLTGLFNRRYLDDRLSAISTDPKYQHIAIVQIDLDRFKHINDTLGHEAGDTILRHVSEVLKSCAPEGATIARTGGDEFVIIIENAASEQAISSLADSLLVQMQQPVLYRDFECRYGGSIGVSTAEGLNIDSKQLLINADIALYRAKNQGRNRWCLFTAEMQTHIIAQKQCADDIIRGLERGEFIPFYQLQFDARTLDVSGVEALARWNHPVRGLLAPDQFLPVAEEIGAVARIDEIILERSLRDLASWRSRSLSVPHLSVNVSGRRLGDEHLLKSVGKLDIPANSLSFELLESIYLDQHSSVVSANLSELRKMGIGIEIDDFGTGHASIAALLRLRPKKFKIDRELVRPIVVSIEQRRLVASIVEIGKSLGIEVVAEGVESREHASILQDLGCEYLQGYAFARPMDAEAIATYVMNNLWRKAA